MGKVVPKALMDEVLARSVSDRWREATKEWSVLFCEEDDGCSGVCLCGQEGLRYLFTIRNKLNGNVLFPIGSTCIEAFGSDEMTDDARCWLAVQRLVDRAVECGHDTMDFWESKGLFSRRLIWFLYEQRVFKPNRYNRFHAELDAEFMVDMFNRRREPTPAQRNKMAVLMRKRIYPFLRGEYLRRRHVTPTESVMRPIETVWRGHRFRSRLEARWAVVMELLGADWEYEPEGFVVDGRPYLPDFLLHGVGGRNGSDFGDGYAPDRGEAPDGDLYVEVKGRWTAEDMDKVSAFSLHRPIIRLGEMPDVSRMGVWGLWADDRMRNFETVDGGDSMAALVATVDGVSLSGFDDAISMDHLDERLTTLAYLAGARCRFDHGETPESLDEFRDAEMIRRARS